MNKLTIFDSELANNPNKRVPICIALDTSYSMDGEKIHALNRAVKMFIDEILNNEMTRFSADVAILTFGGEVRKVLDFGNMEKMEIPAFSASGATPMGEAVLEALSMLEDRKKQYQDNGVEYWQPWLVLMTDGEPTDDDNYTPGATTNPFDMACKKTCDLLRRKKLVLIPVSIDANIEKLSKFCKRPAPLDKLKFSEFFTWLSQSVSVISNSTPGSKWDLPEPSSWTTIEIFDDPDDN